MDSEGRIHELDPLERPTGMISVKGYPDPGCKEYYGRGFNRQLVSGGDVLVLLIVPCRCLGRTNQEIAKAKYTSAGHQWPEKEVKQGIASVEALISSKRQEIAELNDALLRAGDQRTREMIR